MQASFSTLLIKPLAGLLAVVAVFCACRCAIGLNERVAFKNAAECKEFIDSTDLYFQSSSQNGSVGYNFYVADHSISWDDLAGVCTVRECGLTPAWRGIVWVCQLTKCTGTLYPNQVGGKWRVWGNVLVAGDEELMDRIEEYYRNK